MAFEIVRLTVPGEKKKEQGKNLQMKFWKR